MKEINETQNFQKSFEEQEKERKMKAIELLLFQNEIDRIPNPQYSEEKESVIVLKEMILKEINRTPDSGEQSRIPEKEKAMQYYLGLAKYIGDPLYSSAETKSSIQELKEKIRNKPKFLELLRELSDPLTLNIYTESNKAGGYFWDTVFAFQPGVIARLYYPERLKYLANGLNEIQNVTVDEIYGAYVGFLQSNIEFHEGQGHTKPNEKAADGWKSYCDWYKMLTGKEWDGKKK